MHFFLSLLHASQNLSFCEICKVNQQQYKAIIELPFLSALKGRKIQYRTGFTAGCYRFCVIRSLIRGTVSGKSCNDDKVTT
jgi:hypothetical protein